MYVGYWEQIPSVSMTLVLAKFTFGNPSQLSNEHFPGNICPGYICPYQQYLRCYWPDFDPILKVYSWDRFEHNPTVKWTFVLLHFFGRHLSISAIPQLLLTRFRSNFKAMFLGSSITVANCHRDICPGNICPCDICPYQEYLSCYWSDFDQSLKAGSYNYF